MLIADDLVLIEERHDEVNGKFEKLKKNFESKWLKICWNTTKDKIMILQKGNTEQIGKI